MIYQAKISSLLCISLLSLIILSSNQLKKHQDFNECINIEYSKWYYQYVNGVYNKNYYVDLFSVYVNSRFYKIDSPTYNEIIIYDDNTKTIFYLDTENKKYMSVNPKKEPYKKKSMNEMIESNQFTNTGKKLRYSSWNVEIWKIICYGTKESEASRIETISYITRDVSLPNSYFNFHLLEDIITTVKPINRKYTLPGLPVRSETKFYNKLGQIGYTSEEDILLIRYIKNDDSLFQIPKDYKIIEWDPKFFKH